MSEIKTPYLNLQTDFGFKHVFGSLKNKGALIRFLNALFEDRLTVTDVAFHDKEILPSAQDGKRIVYDVYCTIPVSRSDSSFFPLRQTAGSSGKKDCDHHFILEMQNIYTPPFEERIVFYASKMVSEQGKAGWNYELEPVFAVAVTDFNFDHMSPKLVRDVALVDRDSGELLTDKLHIFFCSLREVPERWEECRTEMECILFLIKNMDSMDNTSIAYREGRFTEIFDAARSSRLNSDEIVTYSQSLEKLRDTQLGIRYAAEQASAKA
ncbi:MAG: Rpn family recombination-promoting nuclease/putative transposase, partial [Muribaculaceae bacterium]|nr:Rpn family recombination-promoting nuclease/putative transposase [Muribaculaceae bacterium]